MKGLEPYYQNDYVTLYHGDAAGLEGGGRDGDVTITDPPYNRDYHYDGYKDNLPEKVWLDMLAKVCPLPCVLILYPEDMYKFSHHIGVIPTRVVSWVYPSNTPRQSSSVGFFGLKPDLSKGGQPYRNPKDKRIKKLIAAGKQARLYDWWEVNQVKNVSAEKTGHPCQIPVEVMDRIITITPTKRILDPFSGSGTTLLAAQKHKRKAIGVEISMDYCNIIANRLENS